MAEVIYDKTKGSSHSTVTTDDGQTVRAENVVVVAGGTGGGGSGDVSSVNGKTGAVVLTGNDIKSSISTSSSTGVIATITSHLQYLYDFGMTLQGEVDTNAGKTAELDADVQGKVDKAQGAANAGKALVVGTTGDVTLSASAPLLNNANNDTSLTVGKGAGGTAGSVTAFGQSATTLANYSMAIGTAAQATDEATGSVAIGFAAQVRAPNTALINASGTLAQVTDGNSLVFANSKGTYVIIGEDGKIPVERIPDTVSAEIVHDDTLTGNGTTESPLSVAKPSIIIRRF